MTTTRTTSEQRTAIYAEHQSHQDEMKAALKKERDALTEDYNYRVRSIEANYEKDRRSVTADYTALLLALPAD